MVEVADVGIDALLVHDAHRDDPSLAFALARLSSEGVDTASGAWSPTPFGVFRDIQRPDYGSLVAGQLTDAATKKGPGSLRELLQSAGTWQVA